jgi:hypothetical protein
MKNDENQLFGTSIRGKYIRIYNRHGSLLFSISPVEFIKIVRRIKS